MRWTRWSGPLALAVVGLVGAARADDRQAELDEQLLAEAKTYGAAAIESRALLLRCLAQLAPDQEVDLAARAARLAPRADPAGRELLEALAAKPAPALFHRAPEEGPPTVARVESLLGGAGEAPAVERAARYFRFLAEVDRLQAAAPDAWRELLGRSDHPWVVAQREVWSHDAELDGVVRQLDVLGLPDVGQLPRVRAWTGGWGSAGGEYYADVQEGWLVREGGDSFELLVGLNRLSIQRGPVEGVPEQVRGLEKGRRHEPVEFEDQLVAWLASGGGWSDFGRLDHFASGGVSYAVEALLHARAALQRGRRGLALRLVGLAERLKATQERGQRRGAPTGLWEAAAAELASNRWHHAVLELGEGVPRQEVVRAFERVVSAFPGTEGAQRSRKLLEGLVPQLAEEAGYRAPTWAEWQGLAAAEKLRHLLLNLKDLDGKQYMQPGECDVFVAEQVFPADSPELAEGGWGRGRAVSHRLVELGWEAIPALIELIDDPRPTRSLGYWRNFAPDSYHVLTYGDCALQVLQQITGQSFYERSSTSSYPSTDGPSPTKKRAQAWWAENGKGGPVEALARGVLALDRDSPGKAQRLLELDEARGLAVVREALARSTGWVRAALLDLLADRERPEDTPLLEAEVRSGSDIGCRVTAGQALHARGSDVWLAPLVELLREQVARPAPKDPNAWDHPVQGLYWLVLTSGGAEGLAAARSSWTGLPEEVRRGIAGNLLDWREAGAPFDARDALLLDLLDDERTTLGISTSDVTLETAADLAAFALARHLGLPPFDPAASASERRRRRADIGDAYLRATGQPARERARAGVPPLPEADAARLGAALAKARDELEAAVALGAWEERGLPALAPLRACLAGLGADHVAARVAPATLARLASTVRAVRLEGEVDSWSAETRAWLAALTGRELRANELVARARAELQARPRGELELFLTRDEGEGIELTARSTGGASARAGQASLSFSGRRLRERLSSRGSLSSTRDHLLGAGGAEWWDDQRQGLRALTEAPPEVWGEARVTLEWN